MFDEPGYMSLAIFADERSRPGHVGYRGMPVMERWQGGTQDWSWRCWVNARGRQPRNGRGQNEGTRGIEWWRGGLARRTDSAGLGRRAKEGFDAALLPWTTRSLRPHAPQSPSSPLQPRSTLNPQDPAKANSSAPPLPRTRTKPPPNARSDTTPASSSLDEPHQARPLSTPTQSTSRPRT